MATINGTITHGVTFGQPGYISPLKITGSGLITDSTGVAVYASSTYATPILTNQGTIIDTGGFDAVKLKDGGNVANSAKGSLIEGYTGVYIGGASGTVTNSGTIAGTGASGDGVVLSDGGTVANTAKTGLIQGSTGVDISGAAGTVSNTGTIIATGTSGDGVVLSDGGSVANTSKHVLIQGYTGVEISGAAGAVSNSGTIAGIGTYGAGVLLEAGGNVVNTAKGALIQGATGVDISGAAGTVSNSGTIAGTNGDGLFLGAGGSVGNSGLIQGPGVVSDISPFLIRITGGGVYIAGAAGTVTNAGTITEIGGAALFEVGGSGVFLGAGGSVGNSGLIQGAYGVIFGAPGTIANSGTIVGTAERHGAIWIQGGGGNVNNTGLILGIGSGGIYGGDTVINSGTIEGIYGGVFNLIGPGVDANVVVNTGLIQGSEGVGASTLTNFGTITGTYRVSGAGVDLFSGGSIGNTGLIQGLDGVYSYPGIFFSAPPSAVSNSGTIEGTGTGSKGLGISLGAGGSVGNTGLIQGSQEGVAVGHYYISNYGGTITTYAGGVGTVANSGTIIGMGTSSGAGVAMQDGGSVANSGKHALIEGYRGVYISGGAGTIINSATIVGTGAGIFLGAGGTVIDSGTITSGNGTAISFGGTGGNVLALEHGYKLNGTVTVAGTDNTLELLGAAGSVKVNFNAANAGFTNFGTVAFGAASGNSETLTITNDAVLPGIISDFTQVQDTVDLTQLSSKHATVTLNSSDQLVVGNGSQSVSLQLDPTENYGGIAWTTTGDGHGGTDVTVAQCASMRFTFDDVTTIPSATSNATATIPTPPVPGYSNATLFLASGPTTPSADPSLTHATVPPFWVR